MYGGVRQGAVVSAVFILAAIAAAGGALGLPPLLALGGLAALPFARLAEFRRDPPWEALAGALFIAWAATTWFWSPYERLDQVLKLVLGVPLYAAFVLACSGLEGRWRAIAETSFVFCAFALAVFLLGESLTDGAATRVYKMQVEGYVHDEVHLRNLANRSLGHAGAVLILVAGPAAALAWREGGPIIGLILLALTMAASFSFSTDVNKAAIILAAAAAAFAYWRPRPALSAQFGTFAGAFVVLPIIMPGLIALIPSGLRDALPASWEHRLHIWTFAGEQLRDRAWTGWGFDASRVINADGVMRGDSIQLLPHHPHNGPIQIWLETGAFGVMLLVAALLMIGGRAAGAPLLSRLQSAALAWVAGAYFAYIFFAYGIWQEWHMASLALGIAGVFFLGARRRPA